MENKELTEQINIQGTVIGEFIDVITRYDERGEVVAVEERPLTKNIITAPISTLVAGLIQGTYAGNYSFWAVGTGSQTSSPNLSNLVAEYARKQVAIAFVDQNNANTNTPTGRIIMTVSWAKGELGTVTLTEFGIFSGAGASQSGGGLMMDYVPHQQISLDSTLSLARKIYFQF